jgi:DNA-binding response OmpR family regulator
LKRMNGKIMLADDDESVRRMVARVLESVGYEVLLARNNAEAVACFRRTQPDLILLDWDLAREDDWDALKAIRETNVVVPVAVMTTWPSQALPKEAAAVDALIAKPLELGLLLEFIENRLATHAERRNAEPTFESPRFQRL